MRSSGRRLLLLHVVAISGAPVTTPRRAFLATCLPAALIQSRQRAHAFDFPLLDVVGTQPRVDVISTPSVCQGRCADQDFVVVRYTGRRLTDGTLFDDRYAQKPLTFEVGSFYLPGVDEALEGACCGTKLRLKWKQSPSLGSAEWARLLPPGTPIQVDMEIVTIRYSLFGEKMRNSASDFWFNPEPLTLTSAPDDRGHASSRIPTVKRDNPFSIAPGEKSIISNPSSVLGPLFKGQALF